MWIYILLPLILVLETSVSPCWSSCDFNRLRSLCVAMFFFLIIKNTFTNKTQERKERMLGVIKLKTSEWKLFEGHTI